MKQIECFPGARARAPACPPLIPPLHAKTVHQVWHDFKDQFSQKNAPTIYQIQKSIASLS